MLELGEVLAKLDTEDWLLLERILEVERTKVDDEGLVETILEDWDEDKEVKTALDDTLVATMEGALETSWILLATEDEETTAAAGGDHLLIS